VDFVKIFKDFEIYIQKAALGNLVTFFSKMELLQYKYLVDIIAVDFIKAGEHRFRISYVIKSFFNYEYLHLIFFIKELESIMSIKKIYFGAGWLEREL
jgi:NADH:ubiquinone oxidoreductase subunit C